MNQYLIGAAFALGCLVGAILGAMVHAAAEVHGIDSEDQES